MTMLNQYTVKCKIHFESERKCGLFYKKVETVKNTIPFHFDLIAHDIDELYLLMKEKFDNYMEKVVVTGTFYPWSQVCGCCEWNINFDHVLKCSYEIDEDVELWARDVRKFSAKEVMEELTLDQIMEIWGADVAKIFIQNT